jgi:hypothetical protein
VPLILLSSTPYALKYRLFGEDPVEESRTQAELIAEARGSLKHLFESVQTDAEWIALEERPDNRLSVYAHSLVAGVTVACLFEIDVGQRLFSCYGGEGNPLGIFEIRLNHSIER